MIFKPCHALPCLLLLCTCALCLCQTAHAALKAKGSTSLEESYNPVPAEGDILLPMPCGLSMALRLTAVPARGLLWDMNTRPGRDDGSNPERAYYDKRFNAPLSAPFTRADLPASWQAPAGEYYFYATGKYEISTLQYEAIMTGQCPAPDALTEDSARPISAISWFDAVSFTEKYTAWLLENHPEALPHFHADERNVGFIRLPTEAEWEYAARGGQNSQPNQILQEDFFALPEGESLSNYAVFRPEGAAHIEDKALRIGSRKPNPLGLYDTAGNVAEMTLDAFRFSVGGRLHGSAGGFVKKGGSFFSGEAAIMPGRREEAPFFQNNGVLKSRDMGFRIVVAGINTPGGERPQQLHAAWEKAGQWAQAPQQDAAASPLEELDRLIASTNNDEQKQNLQKLRAQLKDSTVAQERQKQYEAQSLVMTGMYMIESIRNYHSRRTALLGQINIWKADKAKTKNAAEKKQLANNLQTAQRGISMFDTSLNESLAFYRAKATEAGQIAAPLLLQAFSEAEQQFKHDDPFNENMRLNLALFKEHCTLAQKQGLPTKAGMMEAITKRRFK